MSVYKDNDCVGCPQGCIHCGRNKDYFVYECDKCGATSKDEEFLEDIKGMDLCPECLKEMYGEEDDAEC